MSYLSNQYNNYNENKYYSSPNYMREEVIIEVSLYVQWLISNNYISEHSYSFELKPFINDVADKICSDHGIELIKQGERYLAGVVEDYVNDYLDIHNINRR